MLDDPLATPNSFGHIPMNKQRPLYPNILGYLLYNKI